MRVDSNKRPRSNELWRKYPPSRFRRYPRWRPGWSVAAPRHIRFLYVEMLADFLRSQCAEVKQTWQKDGVQLACDSGEAYFCSYRNRGLRPTGRTDTTLATQVDDLFGEPTVDPQSGADLQHAQTEQDSKRIRAVLDLDASPPHDVVVEELRRGTLIATLFTPFTYALLIVGLVLGHYPGKELFGKGELYLAAGVALTPAVMLANQKWQALRKAGIVPLRMTSLYNGALIMLWLCDFTLWLVLTIDAQHPSKFHSGWVAEWGGITAVLIAFSILSPFSHPRGG